MVWPHGLLLTHGPGVVVGRWWSVLCCIVPAILFRCPNTGHHVQGWIAEDVSDTDEDSYQSVACLACQQAHLVNPKTKKVIGGSEE
jgi:hypothetical protein